MKRLVLVAIVAGILAVPHWSRAALWPEITVDPERPIAGELARITVEGLAIFGEDVECRTSPGATVVPFIDVAEPGSTTLPDTVEVTAISPDPDGPDATPVSRFAIPEDAIVVTLLWSAEDALWVGDIVFPMPGDWTLRMTSPTWSGDPACIGHEITVTVLPGDEAATPAATASP